MFHSSLILRCLFRKYYDCGLLLGMTIIRPDKYEQMNSSELLKLFPRYHAKLDEYVRAAKIMDEKTFRLTYEKDHGTLPFCIIHLPQIPLSLYRSRLERKVGSDEDLSSPQTFSYVPQSSTNEHFPNLQRANFSGQSIFYGSLSPTTNFREISDDITVGEEIYMAKWNISPDANLMINRVLPPCGTIINDNLRSILGLDEEKSEAFEVFFEKLGNLLMSTEEGSSKYLVSSLYANFIYKFQPKDLPDGSKLKPFDGIAYPSTKVVDGSEWNMAIKPECIDKFATLQYVVRGKVAKDLHSVEFSDIGFCKNGEIHWYSPWISHDDVVPIDYFLFDTSDRMINIKGGILYDKVGKEIPNPFVVFELQKEQWVGYYIKNMQPALKPDVNIEEISEENLSSTTFKGDGILRDVIGWKYVADGKNYEIGRIGFNFQVTSTYKRTDRPKGINWH